MAGTRSINVACMLTLLCGSAAGPAVAETNASETGQLSSSQAQTIRQFIDEKQAAWQQRLNLEDWHISVVMTHRSDLKPKTLGGIRWDKGKKTAVISVLDPSDYKMSFHDMLDDMELTLVHEMVHLELASLPRSEASRSSEEHAVNGLAAALVRLDKQK